MSAKPVLYSYYRSSCSWRVRAALALKGVDYIYKSVNLIVNGGEQYTEEYRKLNPLEQVPCFQVNGNTLIESLAIIDYINEQYDGPSLLPTDPILRAKCRAIAETITSGIQPLQNLSVLIRVKEATNVDLGDRSSWAHYWINLKFKSLEKLLRETSGKCCVGDDITLADICLVPQVYNANRFDVDMSQFPVINTINAYLLKHDAFIKSHPSQQPDCPPQIKQTL